MNEARYEDLSKHADNALAQMQQVTTLKELKILGASRGAALAARNADCAPQLLTFAFHDVFDKVFERIAELGWAQSVPFENLGLNLGECATLADLLHVIHLPLCNNNLPMSPADREVAYNAVKRLQQALSNLSPAKLATMNADMQDNLNAFENREADITGEKFIIVWTGVDRTALTLTRAYKHDFGLYPRASREAFDNRESAASYASALAAQHNLAYIEPHEPHYLD